MPMSSLRIAAAVAAILSCAHATAQEAQPIKLDIPAQRLDKALNSWAEQTGYQVMIPSDDPAARERSSPKIQGTYTPEGALKVLLASSDLKYRFVSERAVTIRSAAAPTTPANAVTPSTKTEATGPNVPLSQAQSRPREEKEATSGLPSDGSGEEPRREAPGATQEVVVTGTLIRGAQNESVRTLVLSKSYIDSTGVSTTNDLMRTLPQNFALANQSGVNVPGVTSTAEQGASINLRGIGEGTTLVLLNGHRLAPGFLGSAVDISSLPISVLDHVDVLPDGASALYGSDAVGGVVNFILRRDFDGSETRLHTGVAEGGLAEYRASQTVGSAWASGNALISADFYRRDMLHADERAYVPADAGIGSLLPQDKIYSVMLNGHQRASDRVDMYADALYTKRSSRNDAGLTVFAQHNITDNPQFSGTIGADVGLVRDWNLDVSGTYGRNTLDQTQQNSSLPGGSYLVNTKSQTAQATAIADGTIYDLPAGSMRLALGAEWRSERLNLATSYGSGAPGFTNSFSRNIRSAFTELNIPLLSRSADIEHQSPILSASLAGRYDNYSDFGAAFNPKAGLAWRPTESVRFRGTYSTAYVAPKLATYDLSANSAVALTQPDPGVPSGESHQLWIGGNATEDLKAQKSKNLSLGIDIIPQSRTYPTVSASYFDIKYRDQIALPPAASIVLGNAAAFGQLVTRSPTVADIQRAIAIGNLGQGFFAYTPTFDNDTNFDPASIDVILDLRMRNLSVIRTRGVDLSLKQSIDLLNSELSWGIDGTYLAHQIRQITAESAEYDTIGTVYNPPHVRGRASLGWNKGGFSAISFINYTGAYQDVRDDEARSPVASYTTVDLNLTYKFDQRFRASALSGLTISLSVQNALNRRPPGVAVLTPGMDLGFDPTNASPLQRFGALDVTFRW